MQRDITIEGNDVYLHGEDGSVEYVVKGKRKFVELLDDMNILNVDVTYKGRVSYPVKDDIWKRLKPIDEDDLVV